MRINLYGGVGYMTSNGFAIYPDEVLSQLAEADGDIDVHIHSPGGFVGDGVLIYNALRDYNKGKVRVYNDAWALSIASLILLAGDEIYLKPGSQVMVHAPHMQAAGNVAEFEEAIKALQSSADSIADVYQDRLGVDAATAQKYVTSTNWFTANQAAELGFGKLAAEDGSSKASAGEDDLPHFDISACNYDNVPKNLETTNKRKAEAALRDAGFSRKVAKIIVSQGFPLEGPGGGSDDAKTSKADGDDAGSTFTLELPKQFKG